MSIVGVLNYQLNYIILEDDVLAAVIPAVGLLMSQHRAPVAHDAVGVVVDDLAVVLVEARRQVRLCCCQPNGVAHTLAQGTCTTKRPCYEVRGATRSDSICEQMPASAAHRL